MTALIIHGLRRSGTTILWEAFRSDPTLRCFDEPLHPRLLEGHRTNQKGTWDELSEVLGDPSLHPAAVTPHEELRDTATALQRDWLGRLCHDADRVVIDIVRGWNKLPQLHAACGDVMTLHIIREPISWVTAHLTPKGQTQFKGKLANYYRRQTFFRRRGFYDGYQYETIINAACAIDHPVLRFVKPPASELSRAPAYVKLLAFWWGANCTIHQTCAAANAPYHAVTLAEFAASPDAVLKSASNVAGWTDLAFDTSSVRPVPEGFCATSPKWAQAAAYLGILADVLTPCGQTAAAFQDAFGAACTLRESGMI